MIVSTLPNLLTVWSGGVAGTIAPAREVPDSPFGDDSPLKILLANLNLVVPVISALLVIIVAIIVVCFLRGKGAPHKGNLIFHLFPLCFPPRYRLSPQVSDPGRAPVFPLDSPLDRFEHRRPCGSHCDRHICGNHRNMYCRCKKIPWTSFNSIARYQKHCL